MSTNVQELQTVEIPFKKLSPWEENVRTTVSPKELRNSPHPSARLDCCSPLLSRKHHAGSSRLWLASAVFFRLRWRPPRLAILLATA